jgi:hypothetical protein
MFVSFLFLILPLLASIVNSFSVQKGNKRFVSTSTLQMKVENDAFTRANRATRSAQAGDRTVELRQPLGLELVMKCKNICTHFH